MARTKLYPFSLRHAHDVEFRYNRTKNTLDAYFDGEIKLERADFDKLIDLADALAELLEAVCSGPRTDKAVWLTGAQIGLAKECTLWADIMRNS